MTDTYFQVAHHIIEMVGEYTEKNPEKGKKIMTSFMVIVGGGTLLAGTLMFKRWNAATTHMMSTLAKSGVSQLKSDMENKMMQHQAELKLAATDLKTFKSKIEYCENQFKSFDRLLSEVKMDSDQVKQSVAKMSDELKSIKEGK